MNASKAIEKLMNKQIKKRREQFNRNKKKVKDLDKKVDQILENQKYGNEKK